MMDEKDKIIAKLRGDVKEFKRMMLQNSVDLAKAQDLSRNWESQANRNMECIKHHEKEYDRLDGWYNDQYDALDEFVKEMLTCGVAISPRIKSILSSGNVPKRPTRIA